MNNNVSEFGQLRREDYHSWCKGTIVFPALAMCRILFTVCWDGEIIERNTQLKLDDSVQVLVFSKDNCLPSQIQTAACSYLLQNQNEVATAVSQTLHQAVLQNIDEARHAIGDEALKKNFDEAIAKHQLDTTEGVRKQVELSEIGFLEQGKDEHSYVSFDFDCGWDDEHGISILMHQDKVLAISSCADFYHRGEGLEAHINITQSIA